MARMVYAAFGGAGLAVFVVGLYALARELREPWPATPERTAREPKKGEGFGG